MKSLNSVKQQQYNYISTIHFHVMHQTI
uniref:Uncharacterized protein n=1 Tax=Rhizophora mucronata TaxID=61149 RepID=A0A2P2J1V6_RHIMU